MISNLKWPLVGLIVVALGVGLFVYFDNDSPSPLPKQPIPVDSRELTATEVIPTLNQPIPKGTNVVWCASFLSAWKKLESELAKEPISLTDPPEILTSLNEAPDPRPAIPESALYVAAGWNQKEPRQDKLPEPCCLRRTHFGCSDHGRYQYRRTDSSQVYRLGR